MTIAHIYNYNFHSVFYHEHVLTKDPGTNVATPWHHDQSYYPVDGNLLSLWIPVDPVPKESSISFVQGSHAWKKWFVPRMFDGSGEYKRVKEGINRQEVLGYFLFIVLKNCCLAHHYGLLAYMGSLPE